MSDKEQVVSDGGSTSYYAIPEWATELRHPMEHKNMTPDQANIFKAAYRLGEKSGTSLEYDLNKIIFFANCIKERIQREQTDLPSCFGQQLDKEACFHNCPVKERCYNNESDQT